MQGSGFRFGLLMLVNPKGHVYGALLSSLMLESTRCTQSRSRFPYDKPFKPKRAPF